MVRYEYIGQISYQIGKPLWEILGNLRNNGVGRLITRGAFLRYKEPSFYKIVKVESCNNADDIHQNRRCIVWVELTLRGHLLPQYIELFKPTYKNDFQLIPKEEESQWYERAAELKCERKIFGKYRKMPPLLRNIVIEERKKKGESVTGEPMLEAIISNSKYGYNLARLAEDGETPTHHFEDGIGTPVSPQFYENIEAAKDFFVDKNPWDITVFSKRRGWYD